LSSVENETAEDAEELLIFTTEDTDGSEDHNV
jgi:hypothetical protein